VRVPDAIIGGAFAIGGVAILVATTRFPRQTDGSPGPALFPQVLAVLMLVCGAALAGQSLARAAAGRATPPETLGARGVANALAVFAAIIFFMAAGPSLGFLVTSAIILVALMWWLGTPPLRAALAAVGLTIFVYVVFGKVLRVPLPLGVLWF
jgi:putative tricarboxylic transport membrane protein